MSKPVSTDLQANTACADPESFVRGGPDLITFFFIINFFI